MDVSKEAAARVTAGDAQTYHGHVLTGKVCGCHLSQGLRLPTHAFMAYLSIHVCHCMCKRSLGPVEFGETGAQRMFARSVTLLRAVSFRGVKSDLWHQVPYFDLLFLNKCAWAFGSYAVAARDDLVLEQNASSGRYGICCVVTTLGHLRMWRCNHHNTTLQQGRSLRWRLTYVM